MELKVLSDLISSISAEENSYEVILRQMTSQELLDVLRNCPPTGEDDLFQKRRINLTKRILHEKQEIEPFKDTLMIENVVEMSVVIRHKDGLTLVMDQTGIDLTPRYLDQYFFDHTLHKLNGKIVVGRAMSSSDGHPRLFAWKHKNHIVIHPTNDNKVHFIQSITIETDHKELSCEFQVNQYQCQLLPTENGTLMIDFINQKFERMRQCEFGFPKHNDLIFLSFANYPKEKGPYTRMKTKIIETLPLN